MPLLEIIPSEKLLKMSAEEFKKTANECRKKQKSVTRRLHIIRHDIREFESRKTLKSAGRRKHEELCACVQELGNEEQGYELQQKELERAIRAWFI